MRTIRIAMFIWAIVTVCIWNESRGWGFTALGCIGLGALILERTELARANRALRHYAGFYSSDSERTTARVEHAFRAGFIAGESASNVYQQGDKK